MKSVRSRQNNFPPNRSVTPPLFIFRSTLTFPLRSTSSDSPMETLTPPPLTRSASQNRLPPPTSPIKTSPLPAAPSPAKPPPLHHIPTPEKPIQLPRRHRNRAVALSLKAVKSVAARGLKRIADRPDWTGSVDDLSSLEQQLVPKPSRKLPQAKASVKLNEKYEALAEFFNCMVSSVQLLRLRRSMSTFPNICASIQNLSDRKFSYVHLAQMKYVFSEAVLITKVVVRDEVTCCMKSELQVALHVGAVREDKRRKGETGYLALRRVFRERLVDFANKHPQGDDVPEEMLPHPFNQRTEILPPKQERVLADSVSAETVLVTFSTSQFTGPSHIPRSFKPCFSSRTISREQKTSLLCLDQPNSKDINPISSISPIKYVSTPPTDGKYPLGLPTAFPSPSKQGTPQNDKMKVLRAESPSLREFSISEGTPDKHGSTPARLMSRTPELQTPKKSRLMICDSPRLVKSEKRSIRTKLFRTPMKSKKREEDKREPACLSFDDDEEDEDVLSFLPKELLQSIKEKERKVSEERQAGLVETKRQQKLLSRLPSVFDSVLLIFQSTQRSTMTKQELIHKIIASHNKIVDTGEAEEQLKLLQELVPDYIFEKLSLSGDTLCCVNKMSIPEEIRRRLAEAI